jgi:hypothetical protein
VVRAFSPVDLDPSPERSSTATVLVVDCGESTTDVVLLRMETPAGETSQVESRVVRHFAQTGAGLEVTRRIAEVLKDMLRESNPDKARTLLRTNLLERTSRRIAEADRMSRRGRTAQSAFCPGAEASPEAGPQRCGGTGRNGDPLDGGAPEYGACLPGERSFAETFSRESCRTCSLPERRRCGVDARAGRASFGVALSEDPRL